MNIFVNCISNARAGLTNELITNYLNFNSIKHKVIDIYDKPSPLDSLLSNKEKNLLIITSWDFCLALLRNPDLKEKLNHYIHLNNYIWVWDDNDTIFHIWKFKEQLDEFDNNIKSNQLKIFLEGDILNKEKYSFKNIEFVFVNWTPSLHELRIQHSTVEKTNCKYDYFTTTVLKTDRVHNHRFMLRDEIMSRPLLVERGLNVFRNENDPYVGQQPLQHDWAHGFPSMDLYSNAWIELVSETYGEDLILEGEKTWKPIQTKTPFLIQTSSGYLQWLRNKGFKTFNGLIDESYDLEPDLQKRTKMIADVLEDIIKNGSEQFYLACADILEHNQKRLFELLGRKQYDLDLMFHNNLLSINYKF